MESFVVSTGSVDETYVWSVATQTVHHTLRGNAASLHGSCLIGGATLASAQSDRPVVHLHRLPSDGCVKCPVAERCVLAASPDGALLFGGGASGKLYVWATGSGELLRSVEAHFAAVSCLATTCDGACVVTGGEDGVVHAWLVSSLVDSAAEGRRPAAAHTWAGHGLRVTSLLCGLGPYGETVVYSASLDCTVKLWRLSSGALVADVVFPRAVTALALDATEQRLFAGATDGSIRCVNLRTTPLDAHSTVDAGARALSGHSAEVTCLSVAAIGARPVLVSGGRDGAVHVWDVESSELVASFKRHAGTGPVTGLAVVLLPPGCVFPSSALPVAKLSKFAPEKRADGGLLWKCVALPLPAPSPLLGVAAADADAVVDEDRVAQLERENAELRAANKRLYGFQIDKVLAKRRKSGPQMKRN